ncbi:MAG: arginine deiminase-related protein [Sulfobacillus sp.]
MHLASAVVVVAPDYFDFNPESNTDNAFSCLPAPSDLLRRLREAVRTEHRGLVSALESEGVTVHHLSPVPGTPDGVFPNNWFSTDGDGNLFIFPMKCLTRRRERRVQELVSLIASESQLPSPMPVMVHDLSPDEELFPGKFLEGTGSLVLDRENRIAYACRSPRTDGEEFEKWCTLAGYAGVLFSAHDLNGNPIYHTNVMMAILPEDRPKGGIVVVCLSAISPEDRGRVMGSLRQRKIIDISFAQMNRFCANVLALRASSVSTPLLVVSQTAWEAFLPDQRQELQRAFKVSSVAVPTIERIGGGSVRCMLAEIF